MDIEYPSLEAALEYWLNSTCPKDGEKIVQLRVKVQLKNKKLEQATVLLPDLEEPQLQGK